MKKKDIEQLKNATVKELAAQVAEARTKLQGLFFDRSVGKINNPHEIQHLKKHIARMLTFSKLNSETK